MEKFSGVQADELFLTGATMNVSRRNFFAVVVASVVAPMQILQAVGFNKKASVQLMAESMREFSNAFSVDTGVLRAMNYMDKHIRVSP